MSEKPFTKEDFENDMKNFKFTYGNAINAINTSKRLEKVIDFFEKQQEGNYRPEYNLLLSYFRDIRDGALPEYVMKE